MVAQYGVLGFEIERNKWSDVIIFDGRGVAEGISWFHGDEIHCHDCWHFRLNCFI